MSDKGRGATQSTGHLAKKHRADIDGLRAVAILGVLAYHFGLGVPGGYGGVDVFFVISGVSNRRHHQVGTRSRNVLARAVLRPAHSQDTSGIDGLLSGNDGIRNRRSVSA